MKIIFSDNSLRELINFRGDVIVHYIEANHEVILVSDNNSQLPPQLSKAKFIPININRGGMNPFKDICYFFSLLNIYLKEKPQYILHYTIKPHIYGSIAAAILKIPSTSMIAGLGYVFTHKNIGSKIAIFLYRFAMKFPEKIFVLNKYNRDFIIEKKIANKDKIIFLKGGEGINLHKFKI